MDKRKNELEQEQTELQKHIETAKVEVTKPFPQEEELQKKAARLIELDTILNMENQGSGVPEAGEPEEKEPAQGRPSVLNRIREPVVRAAGTPEKKKVKQEVL